MRDTSYLPLQKSQLGAYQDDLKAALNQETWKPSTLWKKCYKKVPQKLGTAHSSYSGLSVWSMASALSRTLPAAPSLTSPSETTQLMITHVSSKWKQSLLMKTSAEVWGIIQHTAVSLHSSVSACCWTVGDDASGNHRDAHQVAPRVSSSVWPSYNLSTNHCGRAQRAEMDTFRLFLEL